MCGIAGILNFDGAKVDPRSINRMTDIIRHRGPDGEGIWIDSNVGLGHRRLAIIDLDARASQPMVSANGQFVISFNGEIYNYKELQKIVLSKGLTLRTNSDTEVILCLFQIFGAEAIEMLRGMFAFALWDAGTKDLVLVRDRLGIKPLYYSLSARGIVFGSEIKAIAAVQPQLTFNTDAFWKFIRKSTYSDNETVFSEIKTVEPGTYLDISGGEVRLRRYWDLSAIFRNPVDYHLKEEDYIRRFHDEFSDAVEHHLVSDVPVGGFLSGGLDSSTVMAYMRKMRPGGDIYTTSIVFPEHPVRYNEETYSDAVSRHLNTLHEKVPFRDDFFEDMGELAWFGDEPFGIIASYALYRLAERSAQKVKVVLTGDGADEVLAGYQGYVSNVTPKYYSMRSVFRVASGLITMVSARAGMNTDILNSVWLKLKMHSEPTPYNYANSVTNAGAYYYLAFNQDYLLSAWESWHRNSSALSYEDLENDSELRRRLFSSMKTRLVDEMLAKVDRMTMAHSLEARVPFLDHKLVEFCVPMPDDLKVRSSPAGVKSKYILRKASESVLPADIVYREKHGFNHPIDIWVRDNASQIGETVENGVLVKHGILDRTKMRRILREHAAGSKNHAGFVFNIFVFEKWYEAYKSRIDGFTMSF